MSVDQYQCTKKYVMNLSPILAGKFAMNTASPTPDDIADKLVELFHDEMESEN